MEAWFALLVGIFFTVAVYLMLSKFIIRVLLGVAVLGNAVNLLIFTGGRLTRDVPPVITAGADALDGPAANALPQALILTAIVISFSFFAFLLVLAWRAYEDLSTDNTDEMRVAEPVKEPMPPLGY
ncbi:MULTISPECIES: Na+/H+ antiporter subunit C [Sinorhizobium]|uniref:Na+/H+ antiporter subunit C n=1 Tax=Sinorhizobium psoraleae TaxID=520838 RepID=A0ABT4KEZ3_9HYPH|nr:MULTISPECIES: Na+/H+ antiporter subunit C [Sinorhizobium]MCZ4089926.1 Na+/H+ antiporter subunit C [Sinorhizobium psoraleae]MDK1384732.1 Na+/H+ antiporter subunit C [Sinorhizobium sp. 7-81]NRP71239.1 Na(+)/H(+) antiporter subunit C [Sinorhizobium psoraleae]